jgi:polyferredoxin/Tfp pilus assembly protein PilF
VAGRGKLAGIRPSRTGKWRALVLLAVHLLIVAHVTHFIVARRTLSPVEPSEAMYTLELGQVNAGFLFFVLALLSTLVFGRFLCGWGCHLVALQDLCGWLMRKLGVRPRPFRARLLAWAPWVVALYMFVWPTLARVVLEPHAQPLAFSNHLMTTGFWDTFPGPVIAGLTFLCCGFAAVYLLGSKGFCTYGCPYGALFGFADRFAAGRIVVDDRCEQCGHCTATCTSNVRVHEEVRRYGRVVDPGCMKCMDCVSVCPKGALSFGFAKPAWPKWSRAAQAPSRSYDLGLGEEIAAATVCVGTVLCLRGLYDGPPLLLSAGLGGITAFLSVQLWRLGVRPRVTLQGLALKEGARLRPAGHLFAAVTLSWLAFLAHSGVVQWERTWGRWHLDRTEASQADVLGGAFRERVYSERHERSAARSFSHFSRADRWGLLDVVEVKLGLAWGHLLRGEDAAAEQALRAAVALAPRQASQHDQLIAFLQARRGRTDVIRALQDKIAAVEPTAGDEFLLGSLLAEEGRYAEAEAHLEAAVELGPQSSEARYNWGGVLRRIGRHAEAVVQLREAARLAPADADARVELGLAEAAAGDLDGAIASLRDAIALAPDRAESREHLPGLIRELEAQRVRGNESR